MEKDFLLENAAICLLDSPGFLFCGGIAEHVLMEHFREKGNKEILSVQCCRKNIFKEVCFCNKMWDGVNYKGDILSPPAACSGVAFRHILQ